ncbi:MAG: hypothetical protein M3198_05800 [Actinomycetota bacterium]|nr:hypothetical protein [Actinomycetota bacterium]
MSQRSRRRIRARNHALAGLVLLMLLALAACGGGAGGGAEGPSTLRSTASIQIVEPAPGAVVPAADTLVKIQLTGARLLPQATTTVRPDEGHIHLKLDGRIVTLLGGLEEHLKDLTPGPHLLEAEFVAGDHTPFMPRVVQTVTFTAQ